MTTGSFDTYRSHWLAIVVADNSLEKWDGSINLLLGQESHDSDHSQTSVVEFLDKALGLLFLTGVLAEAKRIKEVLRHRVRDEFRVLAELGVLSWSSSLHVVGSGGLREPLQESNKGDDLGLAQERKGIPLLRRGSSAGEHVSSHVNWPREVDSGGSDKVSNESSHGNTAVLDLGLTDEANGLLVGESSELGRKEVDGVVHLKEEKGCHG